MSLENPDRYNIEDIARVMRAAMKDYVDKNPNSNYEEACKIGVGAAMRLGKGHFNPKIIESIALLERSVYGNTNYCLPCSC